MYNSIIRYPLVKVGTTTIEMPRETKVLSAHFHRTELELHVLSDFRYAGYLCTRRFVSLPVGETCPSFSGKYIGWAIKNGKIYHVFEIQEGP